MHPMHRLPPLLASILSLLALRGVALSAPYEPIVVGKSPCSENRSIENTLCHMGRRGLKVKQANQAEGRTLTILGKRKTDTRSHLVPRWQGEKPFRVDLRPESAREKEIQRKRRSILEERGKEEETQESPLLRVRAKSGTRGEAIAPLCSKRHGLALLGCLEDLGIDISPQTVDEDTWKLYQMRTDQSH